MIHESQWGATQDFTHVCLQATPANDASLQFLHRPTSTVHCISTSTLPLTRAKKSNKITLTLLHNTQKAYTTQLTAETSLSKKMDIY